jgi:hypothetical protein
LDEFDQLMASATSSSVGASISAVAASGVASCRPVGGALLPEGSTGTTLAPGAECEEVVCAVLIGALRHAVTTGVTATASEHGQRRGGSGARLP